MHKNTLNLNMTKWLPFLLMTVLFTSCFKYEEVDIEKVNYIDVKSFDAKGATINLSMDIKNPNNYNIKLVDSDLYLYLEGNKVGKAKIGKTIILKKRSTETQNATVKVDFKDTNFSSLQKLVQQANKGKVDFRIKGEVKAKVSLIAKKVAVNYSDQIDLKGISL